MRTIYRLTAIATTLSASIAMAVSTASPLPKIQKQSKTPDLGIQLYSVRDECAKNLPGTLKVIAGIGYKGVEFAGYYGRTAEELKKLLDDDGLKCYGTHVDVNAIKPENIEKTLTFAKELGCKMVVVPWLPEQMRNSSASIMESVKLFDDAAKTAAKFGILVGWHNENYEFRKIDGTTIWEAFWAKAQKPLIMEFDTGNAMEAGEQAAPYLTRYPGKVVAVHIKDHSRTNPTALLGEGDENWGEVIPLLKHKLPIKYYIIEQESYGAPPLTCIQKCFDNFKILWSKYP